MVDRDESDEQDQRGGVLPGEVEADEGVGGARAAGDHGDAGSAGGLAHGLGHVGRATFLAADDVGDGGVVETVEKVEVAFAGDAEYAVDAVRLQGCGDEMACGLLGHGRGPPWALSGVTRMGCYLHRKSPGKRNAGPDACSPSAAVVASGPAVLGFHCLVCELPVAEPEQW